MSSIKTTLSILFAQAINKCFSSEFSTVDPVIKIASRPEFGDYQANFALSLAKQQKTNPITVANKVVNELQANPIFASLTVSGSGFINIKLADTFLIQKKINK
jgi:arginyl-tRNA synthetase